MRVSLDEGLVVFQFGPLTGTLDATAVGCIATPEPDIAIIRPGKYVFIVGRKLGGENTAWKN